jgi:hypothetical protein
VANKLRVALKGERFRRAPLWWCLPGQRPPEETAPTVEAPKEEATEETPLQLQPKRRGPRRLKRTLEIGEFCYGLLALDVLRRVIVEKVRVRYQRTMSESDVTIYARRYAKDAGKPWPV